MGTAAQAVGDAGDWRHFALARFVPNKKIGSEWLARPPSCVIVGSMLHNASLNDSLALVSWRARPRSFVALMGLYESNYVRLNWLTTGVAGLQVAHRSVVTGDCDLLLTVIERTPYTSAVNL